MPQGNSMNGPGFVGGSKSLRIKVIKTVQKYALEVRERAVRMVFEHEAEHDVQWAAIIIDAFSRRIIGWRVARLMHTNLVLGAWSKRGCLGVRPGTWCIPATATVSISRLGTRNS
jgi:transposase InsO family protein